MADALANPDPRALKSLDLRRVVRKEPDLVDPERPQNRCRLLVISLVVGEPEPEVGLHCVEAAVLQRISPELVAESDAPPLLPEVEQHAASRRCDQPERLLQLRAAIAFERPQ